MNSLGQAWASGPPAGVAAVMVGGVLGLLLCRAVGEWFRATDDALPARWTCAVMAVCAAIAAGLLWWWEIVNAGLLPATLRTGATPLVQGEPAARYLAHVVLFWLLAAATWIDFRQRVIPDWITVPGALLGMAYAWVWPRSLLPVVVEVPRSFATPAVEADVLAWYGGLGAGGGALGAAPQAAGLALALAIFALWWLVCTEAPPPEDPAPWRSPRKVILGIGLAALAAAWWFGTVRFDAVQTALVGLGVSGGLVWAMRAGASQALGKEAMGLGDVTLMAMVGAWLGWQACVLTFFLAAFIGLGHGVAQFVRHRENELPFGPSLCLAAALVVVAWRPIWQVAGVHFESPGQLILVVAAVVALTAVTLFFWRLYRGVT
ncbi:MAG: prepilin peptidase [Planctomycetia bacterium]